MFKFFRNLYADWQYDRWLKADAKRLSYTLHRSMELSKLRKANINQSLPQSRRPVVSLELPKPSKAPIDTVRLEDIPLHELLRTYALSRQDSLHVKALVIRSLRYPDYTMEDMERGRGKLATS